MLLQNKINNLIIRSASVDDAEALYEIEKYWAEIPGYLVSTANEILPAAYSIMADRLNNSLNSKHIVVLVEGKIIGHALVEEGALWAIKHIGRLSITIHNAYVNKGIGTQLMRSILTWARQDSQLKKIELLVRETNQRAINLYRKFGFQEEGLIQKRIQISPGEYINDVMMGIWLETIND